MLKQRAYCSWVPHDLPTGDQHNPNAKIYMEKTRKENYKPVILITLDTKIPQNINKSNLSKYRKYYYSI